MAVKITPLSKFGVDKKYLAHTPDETLCQHSDLTLQYLYKIIDVKNLKPLIDKLIETIDSKNFEFLKMMYIDTIYLHDLGKLNPYFQAKKMENVYFKQYKEETKSSDHSLLSSQLFIDHYLTAIDKIKDRGTREKFKFILYAFSYHQAKHHGHLASFQSYRAEEKNPRFYWDHLNKLNIPHFEFYILNKLLFSLLVSSDYYATNDYMAGFAVDTFGVLSQKDKTELNKKFQDHIAKFQTPTGINILRNEMFEEAQKNLLLHKDKHIFYLEAPTGSGKTITSINLALKLLETDSNLNKLFYIFPFNTLVEQTKTVFDDIFGESLPIEVINSITPIEVDEDKQEDSETEYKKSYINRLFFHSPAIISTHVALFNILFGTSKEDNFPLWQLANSVIILDEIQSYNNHLWWYMVEFFDKYASLLNIKIIIMSATLPKLDYFLEKKDNFISLISKQKREKLFTDKLFKNRVTPDFTLLDEEVSYQKLFEVLQKQPKDKKILFEFIKKQSAREFYELINDTFDNVYELSGDDNKAYRQYVIDKSNKENLIIVATQVIEAGVDIDMDIGFKDISTIDSEEQFMGRVNRSCKREGKVYFFDLDPVEKIYRDDNRLGFDLKQQEYREVLKNKEFDRYYEGVLEKIKTRGDRFENGLLTNYENFAQLVKMLDYKEIAKTMTLIDSQNLTLYFPFVLDINNYPHMREFEGLDERFITEGKLDGRKVWEEYKAADTIESFAEKKYELFKLNALMQFFTFTIIRFDPKQKPPYYSEEYKGLYLVDDLDFITQEGKFDRNSYLATREELFL